MKPGLQFSLVGRCDSGNSLRRHFVSFVSRGGRASACTLITWACDRRKRYRTSAVGDFEVWLLMADLGSWRTSASRTMGLTEATRAPIPRRTSTRYCLVLSTRSYVRSTTFFSPGRSPFLVSSSVIDARAKSICGQRSDMISPFRIPVASATITMG